MSVGTTEKMEPTLDRTPEAALDFARQGSFQEGRTTAQGAPSTAMLRVGHVLER